MHGPAGGPHQAPYGLTCLVESAVWEPAEEIQEQQRVAEAVGGLHQLLPLLLQVAPGMCPGTAGEEPEGPSLLGEQAAFLRKDEQLDT